MCPSGLGRARSLDKEGTTTRGRRNFFVQRKDRGMGKGRIGYTSEQFRSEFKSLKPCVHGSDAHCIERIGRPDENRYCWVKAELTFEGLKQILYEPADRVFIGEQPAILKNDYQIIESVEVSATPAWFSPSELPLNRDLSRHHRTSRVR